MAIEKVTATLKKEAAPVIKTASVKADALKTDLKAEVKAAPAKVDAAKAEVKKAATTVKKTAAKKATTAKKTAAKAATTVKKAAETKKATVKTTAAVKKAAPAKKTAAATVKKTATKTNMTLQYDDKSYSTEDLEKIANDVWVYDYDKKASELKSIELYVKPFENKVYYVFNGDIQGFFQI